MPTIEERVACLEGRMQDHSALWNELRNGVSDLRDDMNRRFGEARTELDELRTDMNRRFGETRTEIGDLRADVNQLRADVHAEFATQRSETDRRFLWLTGMLVTSALGTMGAVVGLYFK